MIRRSPCEFYLKYLVAHPDQYTDERIVSEIAPAMGLYALGEWYIEYLRGQCNPPVPFYPEDNLHLESHRFTRRENIHQAFQQNEHMKKALVILDRPRFRELIEVLILSGAPNEAGAYALQNRCGFKCSVESVRLYRHYFWNIDLLDTTSIRALLSMRFENVLDDKDPRIRAQYFALSKVRHSDARTTAARLPTSPLTGIIAQLQMGVIPTALNLSALVEATRATATIRAYEATLMGGPVGADMAQKFSVSADIMNKMLETVVKPEDQLREDLQNIALKTEGREVPTIDKLSEGRHTVDLQPEPEPQADDADLESSG